MDYPPGYGEAKSMGTQLSLIRDYIRAAVQDYDSDCYIYSDQALNQQINLSILDLSFDPNNPLSEDTAVAYSQDGNGDFVNNLTIQQKLMLGLSTAVRLLSGTPDEFSYKSPAISVTRKGAVNTLLDRLQDMLSSASGGKFALETDTDFNAIIQGFDRYINDYDRATSAWTGQPPQ